MEHNLDPYEEPDDESVEERVGYGNPPKHTRWEPGFCPNPSGRPPNAKGRRAILERIANERGEVKLDGKLTELSRLETVVFAIRNAMAKGDPTAQKVFDRLLGETSDEVAPKVKATAIFPEKLTAEEWDLEYGHRSSDSIPPPPPKPIGLDQIKHLLKNVPTGFDGEKS